VHAISVTQKAVIGKVAVQGQPKEKTFQDHISTNKSDVVVQICNSAAQEM
jgi:hypothetical protein